MKKFFDWVAASRLGGLRDGLLRGEGVPPLYVGIWSKAKRGLSRLSGRVAP